MKLDADKVRWHRDSRGWTLETTAEKAEVALGTVLRAEHGEDIRPSSGRRIARAFGVDVSELVPEKPGRIKEPALAGKADAPREAGPEEEQSSEAPSPPQLETETDEERRVVPESADSLQRYIDDMKEFKDLREAQMEDIERGVESRALVIQMELADKGLRDLLKELGTLDFVEAVTAGRQMADPKAIPLSHELLRRLAELEALSAEARASSAVVSSDICVESVKGTSEIERRMQEGTLEPRGTES
jgi:transcriptional regulator with XRE-family HTH domain